MAMSMSVKWTRNSQSVANNTTTATLTVTITSNLGSYNLNGMPSSVKVTGNASYSSNFTWTIGQDSTKQVFSRQFTIAHDDDGTAKVTAKVTCDTQVSSGTLTKTVSLTPPTIARASTITVPSKGTFGQAVSISIDRKSSSFTHKLRYKFGDLTGTITSSASTSYSWTPSVATFAPEIPTKTSGTMTIYCDTYKGSTKIGTKSDSISMSLPSSTVPTISSLAMSDTKSYSGTYGAYVQDKSSVKATVTAAGVYGSTIKTYTVKMDDLSYSGTASSGTLGAPSNTGSRTVTATVTDSRGRTATKTTTITVAAYSPPNIASSWAKRWNTSSGKEDDESSTVRIHAQGSVTNINSKGLNKATVKIEYKSASASSWTTKSTGTYTTSWNFNTDQTGLSSNTQYQVRITVTDSLGTVTTQTYTIETASPVLDFLANGTGMGVGRVSSLSNVLDSQYAIYPRTGLYMPCVGTNSNSQPWIKIASINTKENGDIAIIRVYTGNGNSGDPFQNAWYRIFVKDSYQATAAAADSAGILVETYNMSHNRNDVTVKVIATSATVMTVWAKHSYSYTQVFAVAEKSRNCTITFGTSSEQTTTEPTGTSLLVNHKTIYYASRNSTMRTVIDDHIALGNGKYLQGELSSGSFSNILCMNSSNQVELNWTSGGLKGRVLKLIWSGTWTSGNITVSEAPYYNIFLLGFSDTVTSAFAIRSPHSTSTIRGIGGYRVASTGNQQIIAFDIGASGTTLTIKSQPKWVNHTPNSDHTIATGISVTEIYGVL